MNWKLRVYFCNHLRSRSDISIISYIVFPEGWFEILLMYEVTFSFYVYSHQELKNHKCHTKTHFLKNYHVYCPNSLKWFVQSLVTMGCRRDRVPLQCSRYFKVTVNDVRSGSTRNQNPSYSFWQRRRRQCVSTRIKKSKVCVV